MKGWKRRYGAAGVPINTADPGRVAFQGLKRRFIGEGPDEDMAVHTAGAEVLTVRAPGYIGDI